MKSQIPNTMRAVAFDQFGDVTEIKLRTLPAPEVGTGQILIRVQSAGVGRWDVFEREGIFAEMFPGKPTFPHVLGSEGAGTVAAVGENVVSFQEGDHVYGHIPVGSPKGGFYAEYAAVDAERVWAVPHALTTEQAGVMPIDAATALRGLQDILNLKRNETLMIFGASGGIGHFAVQCAKQMGVRVLAVASGNDGVALAQHLGADAIVEGHTGDVAAAAREFAPRGLDATLVTTGGEAVERALAELRDGGRVAYPHGVHPEPKAGTGVRVHGYNANYDPELMEKLNQMIDAGPFEVHVAQTFSLDQTAEAHRALDSHYIGRLALQLS